MVSFSLCEGYRAGVLGDVRVFLRVLEKFAQTLKKNRDALIERHRCKRVKFTVYTKDGRASLKATPVKD